MVNNTVTGAEVTRRRKLLAGFSLTDLLPLAGREVAFHRFGHRGHWFYARGFHFVVGKSRIFRTLCLRAKFASGSCLQIRVETGGLEDRCREIEPRNWRASTDVKNS